MNKIFLGGTGSIASIKLFDIYTSLKKQKIEVIWSLTSSAKAYVLNVLLEKVHGLKEYSPDMDDLEIKINHTLGKCINHGGNSVNLQKYFHNWSPILLNTKSGISDFLDSYEEGIDTAGITSKKKGHVKHINIAQSVDGVLIAPTSANTLSKIVSGVTDNFLLEVIRALDTPKKVYLATAMNTHMLEDPFIQKNVKDLKEIGGEKYQIIPTKIGLLQCGISGDGAMANIEDIIETILPKFN